MKPQRRAVGRPPKHPAGDDHLVVLVDVLRQVLGITSVHQVCRMWGKQLVKSRRRPSTWERQPNRCSPYVWLGFDLLGCKALTMARRYYELKPRPAIEDSGHPAVQIEHERMTTKVTRHSLDSAVALYKLKVAALTRQDVSYYKDDAQQFSFHGNTAALLGL